MNTGYSRLALSLALCTFTIPLATMHDASAQETNNTSELKQLDSILVTARRREESLLDVPLSVSSLGSEALEELGAIDITSVGEITPNITLEVSRGTNSTLSAFIRGVGQQDPVAGFEAGVGIYIDDVYLNRPQAAVVDIFDVNRIEILRGPQGTLYGRNTIGGAVKYVTKRLDPDSPTASIRVNAGSFNQFDQIATTSIPITDTFRVGGAIAHIRRDGYGENLNTGQDNYNKKLLGYRGSAEWEPTQSLFFRASYDKVDDDSNPKHGHRLVTGLLTGAPILDNVFDTRAGLNVPEQKVESEGWSILGEWEANANWTLKNIYASRKDESSSPIDFDSLPSADLDVPIIYTNEQTSNELQLLYSGDKLNGIIGAYYLDANAFNVFDVLLDTAFSGFNAQTLGDVDTKTWSIFANFSYDLTDQLSLTLGGRYTDDERNATILRRSFLGGLSDSFGGNGFVFQTTSDFQGTNSWSDFSPTASLAWKPNDANNLYATYSQGFKGGGFDPRGQSTATPDFNLDGSVSEDEVFSFLGFDPEEVNSIELGWKYGSDTYKHSLAYFYSDYKDIQVPGSIGIDSDGDGAADTFAGITTNAGAAIIQGVEYEADINIFSDAFISGDSFDAKISIGVLNGSYDEFIDAFGNDVSGERDIQNTPDLTVSNTLNYTMPAFGGDLSLLNTISYRGDSQQFEFASPIDQNAFTLWNASAIWNSKNGKWQLGIHGKNLTDEEYIVAGYDLFTTGAPLGLEGTLTGFYGAPRTITGTISWRY